MLIPEHERSIYHDLYKNLIFFPCISQAEFLDATIQQKHGLIKYFEILNGYDIDKNHESEYNRASKKCKRLLEYIVSPTKRSSLSKLIAAPKAYDACLLDNQIDLYNDINKELNNSINSSVKYPIIEKRISHKYMSNILNEIQKEKKKVGIEMDVDECKKNNHISSPLFKQTRTHRF